MGRAVPVRTDYSAGEVHRLAKQAKDAEQARRLLAIAAVLDGASREDAAKIGGMDRQTLRDWVIRFNDQGPNGLINIPSPGAPPRGRTGMLWPPASRQGLPRAGKLTSARRSLFWPWISRRCCGIAWSTKLTGFSPPMRRPAGHIGACPPRTR
jgi:hypothetical protein